MFWNLRPCSRRFRFGFHLVIGRSGLGLGLGLGRSGLGLGLGLGRSGLGLGRSGLGLGLGLAKKVLLTSLCAILLFVYQWNN